MTAAGAQAILPTVPALERFLTAQTGGGTSIHTRFGGSAMGAFGLSFPTHRVLNGTTALRYPDSRRIPYRPLPLSTEAPLMLLCQVALTTSPFRFMMIDTCRTIDYIRANFP
jgi:hypothetical protein